MSKIIGTVTVTSKKIDEKKFKITTQAKYGSIPFNVIKADLVVVGYERVCDEIEKNGELFHLIMDTFKDNDEDFTMKNFNDFFDSLEYKNIKIKPIKEEIKAFSTDTKELLL